ncbi:hypothetical protein [Alloactinosynnema sp. L-07]|nr:hypothetical protein [Alloactinosynnema sp. L-07]
MSAHADTTGSPRTAERQASTISSRKPRGASRACGQRSGPHGEGEEIRCR